MNGDNSFGWNHEATLDNIHAQKYNKAYAGARLTAELKYLLQDVESLIHNTRSGFGTWLWYSRLYRPNDRIRCNPSCPNA